MLFKPTLIIFMTCLPGIMQAKAGPVSISETEGLKVIYEETVTDGVLVYYGGPAFKNRLVSLPLLSPQSCGSNRVTCDHHNNRASTSSCNFLIKALKAKGNHDQHSNTRSICLSLGGDQCCISWARDAPGNFYGNLATAAEKISNQCNVNGRISGFSDDTLLAKTCTKQCLSNRPTGC